MITEFKKKIIVPLSPKYGYEREMECLCMIYNMKYEIVSAQWCIYCKDKKGNKINSEDLKSYEKEQIADNSRLVDPSNGGIFVCYRNEYNNLYTTTTGSEEEGYVTTENEDAPTLMGEFDFFSYVAQHVPSKVDELIKAAGERLIDKIK